VPTNYRTSADRQFLREAVRLRSSTQAGVFRRDQLREWGFDATNLQSMVHAGHWRRLRYGVYIDALDMDAAIGDVRRIHLIECAAAIHALRLPAFAFGTSAAIIHGLPLKQGFAPQPHLIREAYRDARALNRSRPRPDSLKHITLNSHPLAFEQVTIVDGIPVVGRGLAAVSAACQSNPEWAVGLMDAVLWDETSTLPELEAIIARWPLLKGIGIARRAVGQARPGAQSILESLSRLRLVAKGLDEPELQREFRDSDGLIGFADMYWKRLGVVGEADGSNKYEDRADLVAEKSREDRLRALGFMVVRWNWAEIMADPGKVARRILAASRLSHRAAG
jgi:hypothetical protein